MDPQAFEDQVGAAMRNSPDLMAMDDDMEVFIGVHYTHLREVGFSAEGAAGALGASFASVIQMLTIEEVDG